MQSRWRKLLLTKRTRAFATACFISTTAIGQGGCLTSVSDYVHNHYKVGPNYQPPPVPLPPRWTDDGDPRVRVASINLATWWDVFNDPILDDLIKRCYSSNLTLRAAGLQILAVQEQRNVALGEFLPQSQSAALSYSRNMASGNGGSAVGGTAFAGAGLAPPIGTVPVTTPSTPIAGVTDPGLGTTTTVTSFGVGAGAAGAGGGGFGRYFSNWATSLNASWELDFWGLFRRNLEAANASLDQSVFNSDAMTVQLLASVATEYVEIRTLQRRLELARRNVALQQPLVAQLEQRFKTSMTNSFPGYYQLKSNLENTMALIPQLELSLRQANNQLCNLLGLPIQDLLPSLGDGTVANPTDPGKREVHIPRPAEYGVVVAIPAEYLLQRPDVRAAEQQLKIQSAQIGIAEAEMLPHIGLTGSIGLASSDFGHLFSGQPETGSIGPSLTWNILNYGRLLANVRFQNRAYQQVIAQYQQAILNANQDAENALAGYLKTMEQTEHLKESADSASKLTEYLVRQIKGGYLPPGSADTAAFINQLFTAINFQVTQQDAAAQAEGNIALNLILLYRAMGGGWQLRESQNGTPSETAPIQNGLPPMPANQAPNLNLGKPANQAPLPAPIGPGNPALLPAPIKNLAPLEPAKPAEPVKPAEPAKTAESASPDPWKPTPKPVELSPFGQ
jgi:NodT family efflux transporter outer membrane factor (OMF) lipoprotein